MQHNYASQEHDFCSSLHVAGMR